MQRARIFGIAKPRAGERGFDQRMIASEVVSQADGPGATCDKCRKTIRVVAKWMAEQIQVARDEGSAH